MLDGIFHIVCVLVNPSNVAGSYMCPTVSFPFCGWCLYSPGRSVSGFVMNAKDKWWIWWLYQYYLLLTMT